VKAGATGLFLDRDGTINVERGYSSDPDSIELIPGSAEAIRKANEAGLKVFIVTNQSGVARGFYREEDVVAMNKRLLDVLREAGARIDAVYYCPHHPDTGTPPYRIVCSCRKPKTGMLQQAGNEYGIDLASSFVVGDKCTDVQTGRNAGCKSVLVLTGYGAAELERCKTTGPPDHVAEDLLGAWNYIRDILTQRARLSHQS